MNIAVGQVWLTKYSAYPVEIVSVDYGRVKIRYLDQKKPDEDCTVTGFLRWHNQDTGQKRWEDYNASSL